MSKRKYAVVELNDGRVTSVPLDKYDASRMEMIEECDASRIAEKTAYWDKIYNPKPECDRLKYHFYNSKRNRHLWSISPGKESLRGIPYEEEYTLMDK